MTEISIVINVTAYKRLLPEYRSSWSFASRQGRDDPRLLIVAEACQELVTSRCQTLEVHDLFWTQTRFDMDDESDKENSQESHKQKKS